MGKFKIASKDVVKRIQYIEKEEEVCDKVEKRWKV